MRSRTVSRLVNAGGNWNDGSAAGLSAFNSNDALGNANQNIGGRLAYRLMENTADTRTGPCLSAEDEEITPPARRTAESRREDR